MPNCAQCGAENQPGAQFCEMCGSRLSVAPAQPPASAQASAPTLVPGAAGLISCPTCGASAIPGEAFCENCGATLGALVPTVQPAAPPQPPLQPAPQSAYPPPQPIAPPLPGAAAGSVCPSCAAATIPGEAFCENCGAMLGPPSSVTPARPSPIPAPQPATAATAPPPLPVNVSPPQPAPATPPVTMPPQPGPPPAPIGLTSLQGMALEIAGARLALPSSAEAIVGRQDAASGHFPELDLTAQGAIEHGVGRRHARIFVRGGQVQIEDLDSTNGTLVNKQKLKPRQPMTLSGGEELRFGTMAAIFHRST